MAKKTAAQADLFSDISPKNSSVPSGTTVVPNPKPPKTSDFAPMQGLVKTFQLDDKGGYITQEFQDFGYRMAAELDDKERASMYMRLSKNTPRTLLEKALSFVSDAPNVKSKPRLFLWKLKQLKDEHKQKLASKDTAEKI
jgi:hypothetical protein